MSSPWISLISGVIGALVGGVASLTGTMIVGRMQFKRDARVRIFSQIVPCITEQTLPKFLDVNSDENYEAYVSSIAKLAREAQVAGKSEKRAMRKVFLYNTGSEETGRHGTFAF